MKALVKFAKGPGNVEIREVEEPRCGPDQVKLEVAWCGVCGTDLHVLHDTFRNFPPVILGHEMAASIVEPGKDVTGLQQEIGIAFLEPLRSPAVIAFTAATDSLCFASSGGAWAMG
jgi:D-arabinose 1-dehydrogenase-like Zn-dependent alcohol dehydrogenase